VGGRSAVSRQHKRVTQPGQLVQKDSIMIVVGVLASSCSSVASFRRPVNVALACAKWGGRRDAGSSPRPFLPANVAPSAEAVEPPPVEMS
jgi:hypothetical protein